MNCKQSKTDVKATIIAELDKGRVLTALDILKLCNTIKGTNRCNEIIADGYPAAKVPIRLANGKRVMSFYKKVKRGCK